MAPTKKLYGQTLHPYTEALLSAVPKPDPRLRTQRVILRGEVADAAHPPKGCYFHPRCAYADEQCQTQRPPLLEEAPGHTVRCHHAEALSLKGVSALTH